MGWPSYHLPHLPPCQVPCWRVSSSTPSCPHVSSPSLPSPLPEGSPEYDWATNFAYCRAQLRLCKSAEDSILAAAALREAHSEFQIVASRLATIVIKELFLESVSSAIPQSTPTPVLTFALGYLVVFLAHDTTGLLCGAEGIAKHEVGGWVGGWVLVHVWR
jgi:hypothetical protein